MTTLLDRVLQQISTLPSERQDELAEMLIVAAESDLHPYQLSADERRAVHEAQAQARRGEFASDEDMAALWKRFGL